MIKQSHLLIVFHYYYNQNICLQGINACYNIYYSKLECLHFFQNLLPSTLAMNRGDILWERSLQEYNKRDLQEHNKECGWTLQKNTNSKNSLFFVSGFINSFTGAYKKRWCLCLFVFLLPFFGWITDLNLQVSFKLTPQLS